MKNNKKLYTIVWLPILILLCSIFSYPQSKIEKCVSSKEKLGKYQLLAAIRHEGTNYEINMDVVIKPQKFDRAYMIAVAKRIKAEYCHENIIGVNIFDSRKSASGWADLYIRTGGKADRRRGTYYFDKSKGIDSVEFSSRPGNPLDEIKIEIDK